MIEYHERRSELIKIFLKEDGDEEEQEEDEEEKKNTIIVFIDVKLN